VAFLEGHAEVDGELSVVGGDGTRHPGVALCDTRGALEELAKLKGQARAVAALRLANLSIDMERDPAWAAEAVEEGYGLPRLPVAARKRRGSEAPTVTQDLLLAAALLEAIAAWVGMDDDGAVGEGTAIAAGMRVVARVRASEHVPVEGLTPVGAERAKPAGEVPPAEEAKPAEPPVPEKAAPEAVPEIPPPAAPAGDAPAVAVPAPPKPSEPALAPASPKPSEPAAAPASPPPRPERPLGWLTRALRAVRGQGTPKPRPPAVPAPRSPPRAAPPPKAARPAPPPEPAVDDSDPFAPFARALRIEIPPEPPAASPAEEATLAELTGRLLAAARVAAGELVAFPAVALEIVERVHHPLADARSLAGFIARDVALAADVVSVANSAAFRGVSEIESVHDAVARLGLAEVGRVASAVAARKVLVPRGEAGGQAATELFVRAVSVAMAAAGAALHQHGARSDHTWLGGLLHDVGKTLALQLLAHQAAEPGAHLTSVALGERAIERVHAEVGEAAIRQWALPAYLREICAHHHDVDLPADAVDLHLVRLTSALASLGHPAVAARAAREIAQSAGALRMGAPAVRAHAADLRAAEGRARALLR
jgi:HD-like signal output (HDOD) protein